MQIIRDLFNSNLFKAFIIIVFATMLYVLVFSGLPPIEKLIYFHSVFTFALYPLGLYFLICAVKRLFENYMFRVRLFYIGSVDLTYGLYILGITIIYSFIISLMISCAAFGFLGNIVLSILNFVYVSFGYLISVLIYLLIMEVFHCKFSMLFSYSFLMLCEFLNYSYNNIYYVFYDNEILLKYLAILFVVLVALGSLFILIARKGEGEFER